MRSQRGAYIALVVLTVLWGTNWVAMKQALTRAHPIIFNIERTWVAIAALFAVLVIRRRRLLPESWAAVAVTGFFQTTVNMGSTTMAVADGGAGRAAVLVFTMPFWTILLAWPVLGERVRGMQWLAIAFALAGLTLVVEPWHWRRRVEVQGVGRALGFRLGVRDDRDEVLPARARLRHAQFHRVADAARNPAAVSPAVGAAVAGDEWSATFVGLLLWTGALASGFGFVLWIGVLRFLSAGTASLNMLAIPVIALLSSMAIFDERLSASEWVGIGFIGAGLVVISLRAWLGMRRGERVPPGIPLDAGDQ